MNSQKRPLAAQKQPSTAQPWHFGLSHAKSLTTPLFQRQLFKSYSTYHSSDLFQPYQDEQQSPKELPSPVTVDNAGDMASSTHHIHLTLSPTPPPFQRQPLDIIRPYQDERLLPKELPSPITTHNTYDTSSTSPFSPSPNLNQHPAPLRQHPSSPFPPKRQHASVLSSFRQPENFHGQLSRSQPSILTIPRVGKGGHLSPPSSTMVDFSINTTSSVHNILSTSPPAPSCNLDQNPVLLHPCDLHQCSAALHSSPPMPSFSKWRCSSLPPTLH